MKSPALFYNAEIRNNGTARRMIEAFFLLGYKETGMKRYNRVENLEFPKGEHDFFLFIDDGRDDIAMIAPPSPNACYLVDTHLGYEKRLEWARKFERVFLAQLPDVERMKADGVKNVHWLPLACLPGVDACAEEMAELKDFNPGPLGLCKQHDVAFVGFMGGSSKGPGKNDRVLYLDTVFRAFPNSWFAYGKFFLDAAVRYARARVGFNISIKQDLNMRFFEAMSYGSCLATNRNVVGWDLLGFVEGKHFVGFETPEEAVFNIGELLKEPERRENIALAGREFVRAGHTYMHRVNTLLQTCGFPLLKGNSYV